MTRALYIEDCYMKEFEAEVVETNDNEIILDQTAFYPTSGGQPNDTGQMIHENETYTVIDILKREGKIIHKVDRPGLKAGDKIKGVVDWQRRYLLMRHHTAAHVLSTLISSQTGADITGNQLYTDKARVDFSLENFDRELMKSFEERANEIISQNLAVTFRILEREEAFKIPSLVKLRKQLPESIQNIRVVDIGDFDHQACGGTHLRNVSEIGKIEIYDLDNKGKERKRIYFRLT